MRIISALGELTELISTFKKNNQTIGFVPTMGALHDGHLSLILQSIKENDSTVVSIFVNPLQFDNASDLEKYPRVIDEDIKMLGENRVDAVFVPEEQTFYPQKPIISIDFGILSERLEGKFRKGHFEGVGVVVSKFLHLVDPDKVYFGLKDLQQYLLIKRMCNDLHFQCKVIGVDTVREESGLALSSRNRRISSDGLKVAAVINRGLNVIKKGIEERKDLQRLLHDVNKMYESEKGFELEYLEAVSPADLSTVDNYSTLSELAICVAGYVEGVRLIDNLYLRLK
ncbi:pantoate--beta-alanine ligase [Ekhidna sp.]|uniref:pantoate--beta-alanine ligase n=1 Tax=Ekhidna sp. TaxID=2608089 RepID=UPI003BAA29B2